MRRTRLFPAAALALTACTAEPPAAEVPPPEVVPVRVKTLATTTVPRVERRTARVEARRDVQLAFGVPGRVVRITADEGDRVAAGALLATVDTRTLAAQVAQAEAGLQQATRERDRAQALVKTNSLAKQRLDTLESQVTLAEAQLEAARAQMAQGRIRAPFAADVVKRMAEPGAWRMPGQPVLFLAEIDPIRVVAQVPDHVRPTLEVGAEAAVTARGLAEPRAGRVVRVSPVVDLDTGLFRVEIDVANPDRRLAAGQPVEVAIDAGAVEGAYVVEPAWVVYRHDGPAVVVVDAGKARTVPLTERTVRLGGRFVVPQDVLPGLPVVVEGQSQVRDGGPVKVLEGASNAVAGADGE